MAKCYICDACGITIINPQAFKMKEFYVELCLGVDRAFRKHTSKKVKVHLCDDCFHALHEIAERKNANG